MANLAVVAIRIAVLFDGHGVRVIIEIREASRGAEEPAGPVNVVEYDYEKKVKISPVMKTRCLKFKAATERKSILSRALLRPRKIIFLLNTNINEKSSSAAKYTTKWRKQLRYSCEHIPMHTPTPVARASNDGGASKNVEHVLVFFYFRL